MIILGNNRSIFIVQKIKRIMITFYKLVTTIASLEPCNKTTVGVKIIILTLKRTD